MTRSRSTSARTASPPAGRISCLCPHQPPCPPAEGPDRDAARATTHHYDQGWSLLCNGVIVFDDTGEILPTGLIVEPRRVLPRAGEVARARVTVPTPRDRTG